MRQRQSLLQEIIDYAPQTITVQDLAEGRYLLANRLQASVMGREVDAIVGKTLTELVPNQAAAWREEDRQIAASGEPRQIEDRKRNIDGHDQYFLGTKFPVRDRTGAIYAIGCIFQDITARKAIERALQESEERYRSVIAALEEGVIALDSTGTITALNPSASRLLGIAAASALGQALAAIHPNAKDESGAPLSSKDHPALITLYTGQPQTGVILQLQTPDAPTRWLAINAQPLIASGGGMPYGVVCSLSDITARRTMEDELRHRATHDALTSLPNRAGFLAALGAALTPAAEPPATVGVLFMDLDHFKAVNDRLGHEHGDALLATVAARLTACLPNGAVGARLGGDEFTVCLPHLAAPPQREAGRGAHPARGAGTVSNSRARRSASRRVSASRSGVPDATLRKSCCAAPMPPSTRQNSAVGRGTMSRSRPARSSSNARPAPQVPSSRRAQRRHSRQRTPIARSPHGPTTADGVSLRR